MGCKHDWKPSYTHRDFICTKCGITSQKAGGIKRGRGRKSLYSQFPRREEPGPTDILNAKDPYTAGPRYANFSRQYPDDDGVEVVGGVGSGGRNTTPDGRITPVSEATDSGNGRCSRGGWVVLGLLVLVVGGGIWWVATEGIQMATDAVDDAAGVITEAIDEVAPDVEQGIGAAVDMVSDAVEEVVEDPGSITDAVVDLLPEAVGPYVLQVDDDVTNLPTTQSPEQPTNNPPSDDPPQSPLDRTIWPDTPAATSPTPDTRPTFIERAEGHVRDMTNGERSFHGIRHLASDSRLDGIARDHSQDMANRDYFDHDTPEGLDPTDRGMTVGYNCRKDYGSYYTYGLAENIFWISWAGSNPETLAREIVDSWMASPGHRQNILEPTYDALGVGMAISRTGAVYVTQNFC